MRCSFPLRGVLLGSCRYLAHRGSDLLDVVTLGAERGSFLVSANVGPFRGIGWAYVDPDWGGFESEDNGWGLLGGRLGPWLYRKDTIHMFVNVEQAEVPGTRGKSFDLFNLWMWPMLWPAGLESSEPAQDAGRGSEESTPAASPRVPSVRSKDERDPTWLQYGDIDFNIGLFYGLRAGVNVCELGDFLLGLTTLDPAGDDR